MLIHTDSELKKLLKAKSLKKDYIYDVSFTVSDYLNTDNWKWRVVTLCYNISKRHNYFRDIIEYSSADHAHSEILNNYKITDEWNDDKDLLRRNHYNVYEIGHKDDYPEYFL